MIIKSKKCILAVKLEGSKLEKCTEKRASISKLYVTQVVRGRNFKLYEIAKTLNGLLISKLNCLRNFKLI
jgi:hypothetical protein